MKKLIKIMAVTVLMASSVEAITLEDYNNFISTAKNPVNKQGLICERETVFLNKNPIECIKAAQISLKEYNTLSDKPYGNFQEYTAAMYSSAGNIYDDIKDHDNAIKMRNKALELSPNNAIINNNLAVAYYFGKGVKTNKIKAYEHWRVAAQQGSQEAQKNLDILCKESPWACK